tara:strand:- start:3844 stop:5982 length:2139 start_codon:yes stop_codon:yes gene_type:complete
MPYIGQGLTEGRRRAHNFVATAGQTTFSATYDAGFIDVYQNGILLTASDYTATNGNTVVLGVGASANDEITIIAHQIFSISDTVSAGQGGSFGGAIDVTGNITTTGSLQGPSSFTIDPATHGDNTGTVVIAGDLTVNGTTTTINSTTLTVDDKNIIIASGTSNSSTADGSGLTIDLGSDGTATMVYTHATTSFDFNKAIKADLLSVARGSGSQMIISNTNSSGIQIKGNWIRLQKPGTNTDMIVAKPDGEVELYHSGSQKLETTSTGVTVTGNLLNSAATQGNAFVANTSSTWNALEIFQDRGVANSASGIAFRSQSGTAPAGIVSVALNTTGGREELAFLTSIGNVTNERMRIDESGNIGIGTNSPAGIHSLAKVLEISGGDGGDLIIGNNASSNIGAGAHIGAIAFKNIDSSTGSVPHYAGIRSEAVDTSGNMDLRFYTGTANLEADTPQVYVSTGGHVGIGTTNPGGTLEVTGSSFTNDDAIRAMKTGESSFGIQPRDDGLVRFLVNRIDSGGTHGSYQFNTRDGGTTLTRMSIDNSGNFLIGDITAQPSGSTGGSAFMNSSHGRRNLWLAMTTTADNSLVIFANPNGIVGQIRTSGSGTTYVTSSDRRLKENIIPIQDATEKILAMNPVSHTWIKDKTAPAQHGFIAQEMQSIVPEAVSGDADGEEMMQMDYGRLTPVIVKSLQDALKEISSLKQQISKLEEKINVTK